MQVAASTLTNLPSAKCCSLKTLSCSYQAPLLLSLHPSQGVLQLQNKITGCCGLTPTSN